jgi:hypothetical protein
MTTQTRTIGDAARTLHASILNLVIGRGLISRDELKRQAAAIAGGSNAIAAVAIHQLEREGKIERTKSGKSWRSC